MKTLTQQEFEALPIEKRRYWKERNKIMRKHGISNFLAPDLITYYVPIQINLEDTEGVICETLNIKFKMKYLSDYGHGYNDAIDEIKEALIEALNKLKET